MKLPLRYNVRSVVQRKMRSALTVLGVATAIFVSVTMIGLSRGLILSTLGTASPNNVLVLSKGAESMEFSAIDRSDFHIMSSSEQIHSEAGEVLASPEVYINTFVNFSSAYREGSVVPVDVLVANNDRDISGRIEVTVYSRDQKHSPV